MALPFYWVRFPALPSADFTLSFEPNYPSWFHFVYKSIQKERKKSNLDQIWFTQLPKNFTLWITPCSNSRRTNGH